MAGLLVTGLWPQQPKVLCLNLQHESQIRRGDDGAHWRVCSC